MSSEKTIESKGIGDIIADVFHEIAVLVRYMRLRIAERLRSPLWRFIGGQHPVDYYDEDLFETAAPEQMQKPEDVPVPVIQPRPPMNTISQEQRLLDKFGEKFSARENRKRLAASRASRASKASAEGRQMVFDFGGDLTVEEEEDDDAIYAAVAPGEYMLPPFTIFINKEEEDNFDESEIAATRKTIQDCLDNFNYDAEVGDAVHGPTVTLYKVSIGKGTKVAVVAGYEPELKMALSAKSLRILTPIAGTNFAGIEVPNKTPSNVLFGNMLNGRAWHDSKQLLPLILGRDINGKDIVMDLSKAPHLLVAGATGSGKSVCLNTFIVSLISKFSPDDLKLVLVDPKLVEMQIYNKLPHLLVPVINSVELVLIALRWLIYEMERRYAIFGKCGVKKLSEFNARPPMTEEILDDENKPIPQKLPFIVLVIDELADIMLSAKKDIEALLSRIAAKSRAVGIHVIVATQRPSVDVLTGTIKSNFPTRIAFSTASQIDSRTILDSTGAELLLGRGDMLFKHPSGFELQRIQGAMVTDKEIENVVNFCADQGYMPPASFDSIKNEASMPQSAESNENDDSDVGESDDLLLQAVEIFIETRHSSISFLQRRMKIGYNKAAKLVEEMEKCGIVGPAINGKRDREIIPESLEEAKQMLANRQP